MFTVPHLLFVKYLVRDKLFSMKLSKNQQSVLIAIALDARISIPALARKTGLREHAARSAQLFLLEHNLVRAYANINPGTLGFTDYGIFIRHGLSSRIREKFLDFVREAPTIPWLVELTGHYQYSFALLARTPSEVDSFLLSISDTLGEGIPDKCLATRLHWDLYPPRMHSTSKNHEHISYDCCCPVQTFSKEETRTLEVLARSPLEPISLLAKQLRIPESTCRYRLATLTAKGVLIGTHYDLNYRELGYEKYVVLVHERQPSRSFREQFLSYCNSCKHITSCLRTLAEWTFEVDIVIDAQVTLSEVRDEILHKFEADIDSIEILKYIATHKMKPYPLIAGNS